jgi:hypothetical protein
VRFARWAKSPLRSRITGPQGISIVRQIRERLTLATPSEQEYVFALEVVSSRTIVDAADCVALIAHCALKVGADILLTWNVRDFTRLGSAVIQSRENTIGTVVATLNLPDFRRILDFLRNSTVNE